MLPCTLFNPSHFASNPWKHFWMGPTLVFSHKLFCRSRPYLQFGSWPQPKNCFPGFWIEGTVLLLMHHVHHKPTHWLIPTSKSATQMLSLMNYPDVIPQLRVGSETFFTHVTLEWQWVRSHMIVQILLQHKVLSIFITNTLSVIGVSCDMHIKSRPFEKKPHHNGDIFCPSFLCAHCSYEGFCDSLARTSYHSNRTWGSFLRAVFFSWIERSSAEVNTAVHCEQMYLWTLSMCCWRLVSFWRFPWLGTTSAEKSILGVGVDDCPGGREGLGGE